MKIALPKYLHEHLDNFVALEVCVFWFAVLMACGIPKSGFVHCVVAVSYTHLTLPTSYAV